MSRSESEKTIMPNRARPTAPPVTPVTRAATARRGRQRQRQRGRGFTLIELLVSLTAGLLVSMGVFALSKGATNTFQNEARVASAELSLRAAIARLRSDIQRASFMSTGNYSLDPMITRASGTLPAGITALGGVHLVQGGSTAYTAGATGNYSTINALNPDMLDIGGNLTTTDSYVVNSLDTFGTCTRLWLALDSPPMWRVRAAGAAQQSDALRNLFQPVPKKMPDNSLNPAASAQFIARVVDSTGYSQYVATCLETDAAGFDTGTGRPYVDLASPLVMASQTQGIGGVSGLGAGTLRVNPVQWARWQIGQLQAVAVTASTTASSYKALQETSYGGSPADPTKFDLVRVWLDANLTPVGVPELVAEYAVDFRVGFTVDNAGNGTGMAPTLTSFALGASGNATWGAAVTATGTAFNGPQRIRSVRFAVATRTPLSERGVNVAGPTGSGYLYRYCLDASATLATCKQFARVRTVTSEAALPNQGRLFY